MPLRMKCPQCDKPLKLKEEHVDRRVRCNGCGAVFQASLPLPAEAPAITVPVHTVQELSLVDVPWLNLEGVHVQRAAMAVAATFGICGAFLSWIQVGGHAEFHDVAAGKISVMVLLSLPLLLLYVGVRSSSVSAWARLAVVACALLAGVVLAINRFNLVRLISYDFFRRTSRHLWEIQILALWSHPARLPRVFRGEDVPYAIGPGFYLTLLSAVAIVASAYLLAPSRLSREISPLARWSARELAPKTYLGHVATAAIYWAILFLYFVEVCLAPTRIIWSAIWAVLTLGLVFVVVDGPRLASLYRKHVDQPGALTALSTGVIYSWGLVYLRRISVVVPACLAVMMVWITFNYANDRGRVIGKWVMKKSGAFVSNIYEYGFRNGVLWFITIVFVPVLFGWSFLYARESFRNLVAKLSRQNWGVREVWLKLFVWRASHTRQHQPPQLAKASSERSPAWHEQVWCCAPYMIAALIVLMRFGLLFWSSGKV